MAGKKNYSILFWKSLETGFTAHSNLIPKKLAKKITNKCNLKWPLIHHEFVKLTKKQTNKIKNGSVSIESFSPFKAK